MKGILNDLSFCIPSALRPISQYRLYLLNTLGMSVRSVTASVASSECSLIDGYLVSLAA